MHQILKEHGVQIPQQIESNDLEAILTFIKDNLDFPIVIKPVDSSGTNGVHICETYNDVHRA